MLSVNVHRIRTTGENILPSMTAKTFGDYAIYVDAFFPNVLAFFLNYLHEISFNPKMLSQDHSASSHKSERIFFTIFEVNVKKKRG